ncbi:MAG: response regulator transcription factor [Tissierellia bacterium]|nr:response regulator transcription factor [Tissierellia bacterium]
MKILIVDDHPLVRKGIISTLSFEKTIDEIFEASNKDEAMNTIQRAKPELAIVDLYLSGENGLDIVSDSRRRGYKTKFMILTSSVKKDDFIRAKEIGVEGYILKEAFAEDIIYALRVVLRGKKFIDPEIIKYETSSISQDSYLERLTPREREVLEEIANGLSNCDIAQKLYISENTVKKHVSNILSKLELEHRTQAALLVKKSANF